MNDKLPKFDWKLSFSPRNWQIDALRIWEKEFRGVVSVVTGGGKTVFAEMCILSYKQKYPDGRIVIIVPTLVLQDQWFVSLVEELHVSENQISLFSSQDRSQILREINIFVINTARQIASIIPENSQNMLIVDECHHAGSPENSKSFDFSFQASLGLSATPESEYDDAFNRVISPKIGKIIFRYEYPQASKEGVICPFELINVRVPFLPSEQAEYDKLSKRIALEYKKILKFHGDERKLKILLQRRSAISATAYMRIPVSIKLIQQKCNNRTILFHERINQAQIILEILKRENYAATIYHSRIPPIIRRDNLKLFRHGIFEIIITCRALDEGMNIPETSYGIIASSTASYRQRIQRLGRLLRPSKNKDSSTIFTLYITEQEEKRLINEARNLQDITSISWIKSSI